MQNSYKDISAALLVVLTAILPMCSQSNDEDQNIDSGVNIEEGESEENIESDDDSETTEDTVADSDDDAESNIESDVESDSDIESDAESSVESDADIDTDTDTESDTDQDEDSNSKEDTESNISDTSEGDTDDGEDTEDTDNNTDDNEDTENNTDTDNDSGTAAGSDTEAEAASDTGEVADNPTDTEADTNNEAGSPGCGSGSPLASGNFTEDINGASRSWILDVPTNYDTNNPYRLIFVWHPLTGSANQVASGGYNGLKSLANNTAILATADGLHGSNHEADGTGWWNVDGGDMALLQAMLDKINANLCVDQERIFSTGFSFGGMMSYSVGFEFDVFRAVAPCSGDTQIVPYNENNTEPLPIMAFHGNSDPIVTIDRGQAARDIYLARNGCGTQTQAVSPDPCVQYDGCAAPTIWCEFSGGHDTWSEEPQAIWDFFSQF